MMVHMYLTNPISENNIREMRNNMDDSDIEDFDKFLERNWGIKMKKYDASEDVADDNIIESKTKTVKRGRKPKTVKQ